MFYLETLLQSFIKTKSDSVHALAIVLIEILMQDD